MIHSPCRFCP